VIQQKIGKRIQEFRRKKGLTQENLAEITGVSPHHFSSWERGEYNISLKALVLIIDTLECSADDLFCDVIKKGYKTKASRLTDILERLSQKEQNKILAIVEAAV